MAQQELNRAIHDAYKSYWDKITSGYLDAQRAQTSAYLNYLGSLQQAAKASADAVIESHRAAVAGSDAQAAAETQRKIARRPAAVVRGAAPPPGEGSIRELLMPSEFDLFA